VTTRKEMVARRQAFIDGAICWAGEQTARLKQGKRVTLEEIHEDAASKFPLPEESESADAAGAD
jgi:hypothetical protein